jgi:hypothetical protein
MNEKELKRYVGTMDQLARIRTSVLDDGRGRGIRIADVDNGSGLRFTVLGQVIMGAFSIIALSLSGVFKSNG